MTISIYSVPFGDLCHDAYRITVVTAVGLLRLWSALVPLGVNSPVPLTPKSMRVGPQDGLPTDRSPRRSWAWTTGCR